MPTRSTGTSIDVEHGLAADAALDEGVERSSGVAP